MLIQHLLLRHSISDESPRPRAVVQSNHSLLDRSSLPLVDDQEERPPERVEEQQVTKNGKQAQLTDFLPSKHSARKDSLRLICEKNLSLKQVATSETFRRLLKRSYPEAKDPPRSAATLTKYLSDDAEKIRAQLRKKFEDLRNRGSNSDIEVYFL